MSNPNRQALDAELALNEKLRGEVERLKDELEQQDQVNGGLLSENGSHCAEIRRLQVLVTKLRGALKEVREMAAGESTAAIFNCAWDALKEE